jgi:origin recognition complex subunit 3
MKYRLQSKLPVIDVIAWLTCARHKTQIPTGLIVTGPNIASQELLFNQLAGRLRSDAHVPVVLLRSSDAPNLKTLLKKLIRDATNQKGGDDDDAQIMQTNVSSIIECLNKVLTFPGSQAIELRFGDLV